MPNEISGLDYYQELLNIVSKVFEIDYELLEEALYEVKTFDQLFICILVSKEMGMSLPIILEKRKKAEELALMGELEKAGNNWKTKPNDWN